MKILLLRTKYRPEYTAGVMLINDKFFGYTLEDAVRMTPKQFGVTAIPSGMYQVVVNYSPNFKRDMPLILNVNQFSGVRIHGGNKPGDSLGCPLVAKNRGKGMIWGSLSGELTKRCSRSKKTIWIEIINTREW